MDCTHPVLYSRDGAFYCQICGAVLPLETLAQPKTDDPANEPDKKIDASNKRRKKA